MKEYMAILKDATDGDIPALLDSIKLAASKMNIELKEASEKLGEKSNDKRKQ